MLRNTGTFKRICTRNFLEQQKELSFLAVLVLPEVLKLRQRGGENESQTIVFEYALQTRLYQPLWFT